MVKRTVAGGDLVVLHCYQIWPKALASEDIYIFRFDENGKIVEHWAGPQEMPSDSAHEKGIS